MKTECPECAAAIAAKEDGAGRYVSVCAWEWVENESVPGPPYYSHWARRIDSRTRFDYIAVQYFAVCGLTFVDIQLLGT